MTKTKSAEGTALQKALARPVPAQITDLTTKLKTARANYETAREAEAEFRAARAGNNVDELTGQLARAETRGEVARRIDGEVPADLVKEIATLGKELAAAQAARDGREERLEAFREEIDRRREVIGDVRLELSQVLSDWKQAALGAADQQLAEAARMIGDAYYVAEKLNREATWDYPSFFEGIVGGDHKTKADVMIPAAIGAAVHESTLSNMIVMRP